jgi:hypothetical protein
MPYEIYPDHKPCPCGSGFTYGDCCKEKGFQYEIGKRGQIVKNVPLSPEAVAVFKSAQKDFDKCFGRSPARYDKVMYAQYLHSPEDYSLQFRKIGKSVKVREEILFASERTGLIPTKKNLKLIPEVELDEWDAAIEEYRYHKRKGRDPFFVFSPLSHDGFKCFEELLKHLDYAIIVGSVSVEDCLHPNKIPHRSAIRGSFEAYFVLRALGSLRTIRSMYNDRYDDDCLAIVRSIYESIIRLVWLRGDPKSSKVVEALLGHELGTHKYALRKNNKPDYDNLIDCVTGQRIYVRINNRELCRSSELPSFSDLYSQIYPLMSGYVHPDVSHFLKFYQRGGLSLYPQGNRYFAMAVVAGSALMLLHQIRHIRVLRPRRLRDLNSLISRFKSHYVSYLANPVVSEWIRPFPGIFRVAREIPDKLPLSRPTGRVARSSVRRPVAKLRRESIKA